MIVTVIYPSDGSHEKSRIEYTVNVSDNVSYENALEEAWRLANFVMDTDLPVFQGYAKANGVEMVRSAMVGDVFVAAGRYWVCDNVGFSEMTPEDIAKWVSLPSTNRLLGVKYCKQLKYI